MATTIFTDGNDTYTANTPGSHTLIFIGGNDTLTIFAGSVDALMGEDDDIVSIRGGTSTVYGESGSDRFELYVGSTAFGGSGNDIFNVRGGTGVIAEGGIGDDRFNFYAAAASVILRGGAGNDDFFGYDKVITGSIYGDSGNDYFVGFRGAVSLHGGVGNDIYRADASSPATVVELANAGEDSVQVARGASYTLTANVENISVSGFSGSDITAAATLTGNAIDNTINAHNNVDTLSGLGGNDDLFAKGGNDIVWGGSGNDYLDGGSGDDLLNGDVGNDTLQGRAGDDTMTGGAGNDVYYVDSPGDTVIEEISEGTDVVRTSVDHTLSADVENGIVSGSAGLTLNGNALANTLTGGIGGDILTGLGGNDTLNGGAGQDVMVGGIGDDTYYVDNLADVVTENGGEGTDVIRVTVSEYTLSPEVENGIVAGSNLTLYGNGLDNILIGGVGADFLAGWDGADTHRGGLGNDLVFGGNGNDVIEGGAGDDSLVGQNGTDTMTGGDGDDRFTYHLINDSLPGSSDLITDFEGEIDILDLQQIDANINVAGDQAFFLSASDSASGFAGDLWFTSDGVTGVFFGDVDGNGVADLEIRVVLTTGSFSTFDIIY